MTDRKSYFRTGPVPAPIDDFERIMADWDLEPEVLPAAFDPLSRVRPTGVVRPVGRPKVEHRNSDDTTGIVVHRIPMWSLGRQRGLEHGWWWYVVWVESESSWQVHGPDTLSVVDSSVRKVEDPFLNRKIWIHAIESDGTIRGWYRPPGSLWVRVVVEKRRKSSMWSGSCERLYWGPLSVRRSIDDAPSEAGLKAWLASQFDFDFEEQLPPWIGHEQSVLDLRMRNVSGD